MNPSGALLFPSLASSSGKGATLKKLTLCHYVNKGMVILVMLPCVVKLVEQIQNVICIPVSE